MSVPPVVVGVDLAWSPNNGSGVAIARYRDSGYVLESACTLKTDEDILDCILAAADGGPAVVAIDAPLCVPNDVGGRACEQALSSDFSTRHAGCHSSNRTLFARYGGVRGEHIVRQLAPFGFLLVDGSDLAALPRTVVEVYPHPALVNLFDLQFALKYKRKSRRSAEVRAAAWTRLKQELRKLAEATPSLMGLDTLLDEEDSEQSGRASKEYEDRVDAIVCAYIAIHALHWGSRGCKVYGTVDRGSILVPIRSTTVAVAAV